MIESLANLEAFVALATKAKAVRATGLMLLSGGAIQENWAIDLEITGGPNAGMIEAVVRTDAPSTIACSLGRTEEFAVLSAAYDAGVNTPKPLWLDGDGNITGRPAFITRRVRGVASGHKLVKNPEIVLNNELVKDLGRELARIHSIVPPRDDLSFLSLPTGNPALAAIDQYRRFLDALPMPYPALEWSLLWLEQNAPETGGPVLTHRDFRTGNYMVNNGKISGILDWEFAGWGDPMEDLGWFCARCWRFGADGKGAGGVGDQADFLQAYEAESGRRVEKDVLHYWELMAHARWAVIAAQQGDRFVTGNERSMELALTSHIVPELEMELLAMTAESHA